VLTDTPGPGVAGGVAFLGDSLTDGFLCVGSDTERRSSDVAVDRLRAAG
jgi:hypothetical protein